MPCRLSVNTQAFTLTDAHATSVSDSILDAVRDGGAYVRIAPITGSTSDVLITPATTVAFQRITVLEPSLIQPGELWPDETWFDDYL